MINIQKINVDQAIDYIFNTKKFPVLRTHIEDEVIFDNGNLIYEFINGKDLSNNIYTNDDNTKYQWIGLFDNDNLIALQLLHFIEDSIELVILEKVFGCNIHHVFRNILEYVENQYIPFEIYTFPLHNKLKEEYKKYGFIENNNELIKHYGS